MIYEDDFSQFQGPMEEGEAGMFNEDEGYIDEEGNF